MKSKGMHLFISGPLRWLCDCDAHHRVLLAGGLAILSLLPSRLYLSTTASMVVLWAVFSMALVGLAWARIFLRGPGQRDTEQTARLQDFGGTVIFLSVLAASCMSLFVVGYLLLTARQKGGLVLTSHIALSVATVVCSWVLIHTLFTLRYADLFYQQNGTAGKPGAGLIFPEEPEPDYLDFAYLSFGIGTTCQVADVNITSREIRRLVLLHGAVSFAFNASILALGINIISSLLST